MESDQVCGQRGRNVTVTMAISPTNGLVFHSAVIGGMTARQFDDFLAQTRLNLDPDEHVIFIYDGAPVHYNPAIPGRNTELKKSPPYSPFLNIVEQAISSLKTAIKADISRPEIQEQMHNREEARRQGIALGNCRTQLLQQASCRYTWNQQIHSQKYCVEICKRRQNRGKTTRRPKPC